jgi:hypothetical protein
MRNGRIKRVEERPIGIPTIGKVKIGEKRVNANGKEYPVSLDYFVVDSKYASYFHTAYGDKPSSIEVIFVSDNFRDSCDERYELRDKSGRLYADGDGDVFRVWNDKEQKYTSVKLSEYPTMMEKVAERAQSPKGWEVTLTIRFILPKIPGVFGLWQFTTKGNASSIPSIVDAFDVVLDRAGTVVNIPFDLVVEKVKSQKPGDSSVYPVVQLVPNISNDRLEMVRAFIESGSNVRDVKQLIDGSTLLLGETTAFDEVTDED